MKSCAFVKEPMRECKQTCLSSSAKVNKNVPCQILLKFKKYHTSFKQRNGSANTFLRSQVRKWVMVWQLVWLVCVAWVERGRG